MAGWWPSTPTPSGTLGARIDPHAVGSYWDLAADYHLDTFSDVRMLTVGPKPLHDDSRGLVRILID
jgi:hypothetical protein